MYTITEIYDGRLPQYEVRKADKEDIIGTFDSQEDAKAFIVEQVKKDFTPIQLSQNSLGQ